MFSANQTLSTTTNYSLVTVRGTGEKAYLEVFSSFNANSGWNSDATLSSTKLRIATPSTDLDSGSTVVNFDVSPYDSVAGNNAIACCVSSSNDITLPSIGLRVFKLSRSGGLPVFTGGEFSSTAAYSPNPVTNISVRGAAFNPSGTVLAYSPTRTSPYIKACAWSNSSGFGTFYSNPSSAFYADGLGSSANTTFVKFHPSGGAIFVFSNNWPYVNAWQWSDITGFGTKYATPSIPNNGIGYFTGDAFDVSTNYVAIGVKRDTPGILGSTWNMYVLPFNLSTGFGTPLPQKTMPSPVDPLYPNKSSDVYNLAIHPSEEYIAVGPDTNEQTVFGSGPFPVRYPAVYAYQLSSSGLGDYSSTLNYNGPSNSTLPLACQWSPDGRTLVSIVDDYFLKNAYLTKSTDTRYVGPLFLPFASAIVTQGVNDLTSSYTNGVLCPWYPGAAQIDANYTYCNGDTTAMYSSSFSLNRSKKYYTPNAIRATISGTFGFNESAVRAIKFITA